MKEPARHGLVEARDAVAVFAFFAGTAGLIQGLGKFHKLADEQIEPAIVVVIEPDSAGRPSWSGDTGFLRYVCEGTVAVVVVQDVSAILRDINVRKAIAIVVAHG